MDMWHLPTQARGELPRPWKERKSTRFVRTRAPTPRIPRLQGCAFPRLSNELLLIPLLESPALYWVILDYWTELKSLSEGVSAWDRATRIIIMEHSQHRGEGWTACPGRIMAVKAPVRQRQGRRRTETFILNSWHRPYNTPDGSIPLIPLKGLPSPPSR